MSTKKRGNGTSCHHCKKATQPMKILRCARGEITATNSKKRKRACMKKYCIDCITKWYAPRYIDDNKCGSFICPSCCNECRCAYCRRERVKYCVTLKSINDELDVRSKRIPKLQNLDRLNIEARQTDAMLELLDGKHDIHDIIRTGMSIDFADPNAKILYIAHLIEQALNNPHILKLYALSTNKRAININTPITQITPSRPRPTNIAQVIQPTPAPMSLFAGLPH